MIDLDRLPKLRLVVARFGEMDLLKWWNTKGQLGRYGAAALRRGFPRTHHFAQALSVFAVAGHRCAEWFNPPGCVTPRDVAKVLNRRFDPDGRDRPLALLAKQGEDPPALLAEVRTRQRRHQEELRAFLDEVKRVVPLWGPDLDDGVVINFAPLWRLVPQHKAWQKELRATWDALCGAEYDGSHLAMRLWPERVVPKCAKDRSLAIAHGLEDVFWVEGADGKWTARKKPTMDVDALVQERTSAAVKSALLRLLDAPTAQGVGRRPRKGKA